MNDPVELQKLNYYNYITTSRSGLSFHKWADFCHGEQVNMLFSSSPTADSEPEPVLWQSKIFFKCNLNITNVEFNVSASLLLTHKNRRISLSPRLVILSWATRFEMHTSPLSLTTQRTVVTKPKFFSSPSPTTQNIFFFPYWEGEMATWKQDHARTLLRSLEFCALFLTLVVQRDAVRWLLETWFHQIPPTMSWSLIYIVLKTEEQNIWSKPGILYSLQATLHGVKPPIQNKKSLSCLWKEKPMSEKVGEQLTGGH